MKLIKAIRRTNLDAFWAREPGMVSATKREGAKIGKLGSLLGSYKLCLAMLPSLLEDTMVMV